MKASQLPFEEIGPFILQRVIQDGPYTMAVQSLQPSLHRPVFIKLLKPQIKNQELWLTRFKREAQICARLKHPNIVDVYTIGEIRNYTYMAMEFVRGISLKELLEKEKILPEKLAAHIVYQILQALQYAHQNRVVHRDLKPGNIILDIHGVVKLTDFGLAYLGEEFSVTLEGNILGTPAYMAPEQITGEPLTPGTDLFALGATFYEMLTGVKPFAGENYSACIQKVLNENPQLLSDSNDAITEQVARFVQQLIEKNPEDRPSNSKIATGKLEKLFPQISTSGLKNQLSEIVQKYYDGSEIPVKSGKEAAKEPPVKKKRFTLKRKLALFVPLFLTLTLSVLFSISQIQKNNNPGETKKDADPAAQNPANAETEVLKQLPDLKAQDQIKKSKFASGKNAVSFPQNSKRVSDHVKISDEKAATLPAAEKGSGSEQSFINIPSKSVAVEFDITPWASVSVDGKLIDSLVVQSKIEMMPGKHQFILTHPRFTPKIINVDVKENESPRIIYSFLNDAAFLSIEVRPWAEVYIDRKFIDNTPLNQLIVLAPGEHLLELKHAYYRTYRQLLHLNAGDTLQVKHSMAK